MPVENSTREARGTTNRARRVLQYVEILTGILLLASLLTAQTVASQRSAVTAVQGESWLVHLHRSFDETSMGKTGRLGPPALPAETSHTQLVASAAGFSASDARSASASALESATVTLHGSDLYRLNCRGCHGESGAGAPPEIGSVLNPVRATSVALVRAKMQTLGMNLSAGQAAELAKQSRTALLERIHNGGQDMPALSHLDDAEIGSLLVYLKQLAQVPGTGPAETGIRESHLRVGELIVKSTCHVCHSATGANPTAEQIAAGAIPPLSSLTSRVSRVGFIRKVTQGAPIAMGTPPELCRGRMPVFFYLSEQEAGDVYSYLASYPPEGPASSSASLAALRDDAQTGAWSGQSEFRASFVRDPQPQTRSQARAEAKSDLWLWFAWLFAGLLLASGFAFTVREFRRFSREIEGRKVARLKHIQSFQPVMVCPMPLVASARAESSYAESRETA